MPMSTRIQAQPGLKVRLARHPFVVRMLTRFNVVLYRWSGGRLANEAEGCPVCLVTMTGRKSGRRKTIALMYVPFEDKVLLVASLGGSPRNPAWYYNIKADANIVVQIGRLHRPMIAREATGTERDALWTHAVTHYPSYADYQGRTQRQIPVFLCTAA